MRERYVSKTFEIGPDTPDFYMDNFGSCTFILQGGTASFLMCDMEDCTFVPPLMDGDKIAQVWDDLLAGCTVTGARTRTLIKPDEVKAMAIPKLEHPCRLNSTLTCYTPDHCVFECMRRK